MKEHTNSNDLSRLLNQCDHAHHDPCFDLQIVRQAHYGVNWRAIYWKGGLAQQRRESGGKAVFSHLLEKVNRTIFQLLPKQDITRSRANCGSNYTFPWMPAKGL